MATKTLYAAKDFKYGTRMMRAGDPVDLNGRDQKLYLALGAVTDIAPRRASSLKAEEPVAETVAKPKRKRAAKPKK